MHQSPAHGESAFNKLELLLVVLVMVVVVSVILPSPARGPTRSKRIECLNNLKQIGTAYRIWENDRDFMMPARESVSNGGWQEILAMPDQGAICWTNYKIIADELGHLPKILCCSSDERRPAADFATSFDNTHISYFVGVSAGDDAPQSILGGDRNLSPGNTPDPGYGFSPRSGKGNDVAVPISGPVCWSLKMHSVGNPAGGGNILLGDGSTQQTSSAHFQSMWLSNAPPTTNWPAGHVPASPSIRLIFP